MVSHPDHGTFEFVVLSSLRAAQLMRGCRPRIGGDHKRIVAAQMEVAAGAIGIAPRADDRSIRDGS